MSTYATVVCDVETTDTGRCMSEDTLPALASNANQVRAYLRRQQGWHRTRDGRDICPDCWEANRPSTPTLAPKQAAVLAAAADGAPLSTVAARLGMPRTQVSSRLSEAYRRLDVTWMPRAERRAEAVRIARRHGLIPADTQPDAAHTPDVPRRGPTTALRAPHTPSRLLAPHETATTPQTGTQPANAEQDTN